MKRILAGALLFSVAIAMPQQTVADATANVTNLINRLDPLTANVLSNFVMLTDIPRPTYHEKKVSDALFAWATARDFHPHQDAMNNLWFEVPATPGMEALPKVMLQGHMDMVAAGFADPENECVTLDCDENGKIFSRDRKTSIGADDGLGVAMALTVADGKIPHGPLCVLVTTDEEQTQTGAMAVSAPLFYGKQYLINIDSETDGELTISSAANDVVRVTGNVATVSAAKTSAYCVKIENFRGGHSGQDIDKERLNAILELGRVLTNAVAEGVDFELAEITGGNANNAIPPHAQAIVTIDESQKPQLEELLSAAQTDFQNREEANATVSLVATNGITTVLGETTRDNVLAYLTTVHDGVWNMSSKIPGLVETSMNHGLIGVTKDGVTISGAARGSDESTLQPQETSISNTAKTCGFDFAVSRSCAPWPADTSNPLIGIFSNAWKKVTGGEMSVVATHAGLECGWFSQKAPTVSIVSVGPTIENPHTVNETAYAGSVSNNIQLLSEVLATLYCRYVVKPLEIIILPKGETCSNPLYDGNGALAEVLAEGRLDGTDVTIAGNEVTGDGGAVYSKGQLKLFGSQVTFTNNVAKGIGGAICNFGEVYFFASNTIFRGNAASNNGGAIHNESRVEMSGRVDLQTSSDTWFNYGRPEKYAEVVWRLAGLDAPGDSVCIRNYRYLTNATDYVRMMLDVSPKLPLGIYTLATNIGDDITGKDSFLLSRTGSVAQSPITADGQEVIYANRTYALTAQEQNLILTVSITPVYVVTNAALDVAGTTWQLMNSDTAEALTEVDDAGRFIVQSNSVVTIVYTAEKGKYFKDGSSTYQTGFKAVGAEVFDAAENLTRPKPDSPEPVPVPPGGDVNVPSGYESATDFAEALNDGTADKADYLKAPGGVTTTTDYLSYFSAVPSGKATVAFVLNDDGTNVVEMATEVAATNALAVALSPSVTTLTIADPLVGFYYSLKQGGAVTNLLFNAEGDRNQLGGRDAISFDLTKPEGAGFYQTLITPTEYAE